jgi:hypothetical protein
MPPPNLPFSTPLSQEPTSSPTASKSDALVSEKGMNPWLRD